MAAARLSRNFELIEDAPAAWNWDDYEAWLVAAWAGLLHSADQSDESVFQAFLEQHPCLVPGGEGTGDSFGGHHGGWHGLLVSQPSLPGINKRVPDFMWLTKNSEDIIPVLVELEAPAKPWFNQNRSRSAKLTQAQDQLAEWCQALDNPASRIQLGELYDFPKSWTLTHTLVPRLVLIYGRRGEFLGKPELNQKRRIVSGDIEGMTYDRLHPEAASRNAITVRRSRGKAEVLAVPPTYRLGPSNQDQVGFVIGLEEAIARNPLMSEERRSFLIGRVPYWRSRAQERVTSIHRPSTDWE